MPLFYEIMKLDEYKSGIASRLFVQPETNTFKTKSATGKSCDDCHFACEYFINAIIWRDKKR